MQGRKPELHHKVVTWKLFCSIFLHIAKKNKQTAESMNFTTFKPMFIITDEQGGFFFLCLRPIYEELRENDQISKLRDLCQLLHPSRKSQGFCFRGKREETQQKAEEVHSRETGSRAVIKTSSYG